MKRVWFYDYPALSPEITLRLGIAENDGRISHVFFDCGKMPEGFLPAETDLIKNASVQLSEYFNGERRIFDLPLHLHGTDFQTGVLKALKSIPYGETRSYKEIAVAVGSPRASRAVGMANNRNPIAIIIPCHRVIGTNGSLTGYAGGIYVKKYLLELEKKFINIL